MKKLILFLVVVVLFTMFSACINKWWEYYDPKIWSIYNATEQTLTLKCPIYESDKHISNPIFASDFKYRELELEPKSRVLICRGGIPKKIIQEFDYYFTQSAEAFGEDVSWQILSEDGAVLKIWNYSDRDLPDQRFFDKSEWRDTQSGLWPTFSFAITPEDIQL